MLGAIKTKCEEINSPGFLSTPIKSSSHMNTFPYHENQICSHLSD